MPDDDLQIDKQDRRANKLDVGGSSRLQPQTMKRMSRIAVESQAAGAARIDSGPQTDVMPGDLTSIPEPTRTGGCPSDAPRPKKRGVSGKSKATLTKSVSKSKNADRQV